MEEIGGGNDAKRWAQRGLLISERRLLVALLDGLAVAVAFILAFNLRTTEVRNIGFTIPRFGTVMATLLWYSMSWLMGGYDTRSLVSLRRTMETVISSLTLAWLGLFVTFFVVPYRVTRPTVVLWLPIAALLVIAARLLGRRLIGHISYASPVAMLASQEALRTLDKDLGSSLTTLYRIVAVVDPSSISAGEELQRIAQEGRISHVVVGVRDDISRDIFTALLECHESGIAVRSLADVYEELTGRMLLDQLGHSWLMSLPMRSQTSRLYAALKRTTDIAAGLMALLMLAVFFIPLALLIKLTSPGPVLHRQLRIGKYGRPFRIIKLRTMRASERTTWTEDNDRRVTSVGRVLRKLHLDELPQGWNIVHGDMSIVGPRPEQPQYVTELRSKIDFYNSRLVVRPGLTGWAQVNHGYGSGLDGTRIKLSYDLYYVKNQSLSLDMLILIRTFFTIVALRGL